MVVTPLRAFFFTVGACAVVAGTAYVSGALDPYLAKPPAAVDAGGRNAATAPASGAAPAKTSTPQPSASAQPAAEGGQAAPTAKPQDNAMAAARPAAGAEPAEPAGAPAPATPEKPAAQNTAPARPQVIAPTFDVVRVEGNGSIVVAGQAAPNAKVAVIHGSTVLGETTSDATGAFAIALDDALKPGDYQIVLRSTAPGGIVATSTQTAVVSVPEKSDGQVLALVEEPGKPSELITVPKPPKTPEELPAEDQKANAPQTPAPSATAPAVAEPPAAGPKIAVEAVEIDGGKVFVAGIADPGRKVRVYANDVLLGEATTSPDGHFLVEAMRELAVGDYIIHADALGDDGIKVMARAAVPFQREPGESMAAVAPSNGKPAPAAETQPGSSATAGGASEASPAPASPQARKEQSAEAVPETISPKLEQADGAVIIRRGDSLWRISRRVYGHGIRYSTIYLANQDQIADPDMIWPGQVFKVPETSKEGEPANLKAMGDQATQVPPSDPAAKKP
jgi:nucleoid-associated protein YgaU